VGSDDVLWFPLTRSPLEFYRRARGLEFALGRRQFTRLTPVTRDAARRGRGPIGNALAMTYCAMSQYPAGSAVNEMRERAARQVRWALIRELSLPF
jgi:hypothetical protein